MRKKKKARDIREPDNTSNLLVLESVFFFPSRTVENKTDKTTALFSEYFDTLLVLWVN